MKDNKLFCELPYKERLLQQFPKGSMLWKFYNFIFKNQKGGKQNNDR